MSRPGRDAWFTLRLVVLELKLEAFAHSFERRSTPNQPRVPAGNSDGRGVDGDRRRVAWR